MERLQKVLAQAGVASRRKCEELIQAGRVQIDGKVCSQMGVRVNPDEQNITVDGQPIQLQPKYAMILNKPTSYVTTAADPEGRRTVMDLVDTSRRLYPVGRLDYDTSGLLLLTNDGELANRLMHPRYKIKKTYRATVMGMPDKAALQALMSGIALEDGITEPAQVSVLRHHPGESVVELTIHEGKNRQVRRMFESIGHEVKRLKRIAYGPLELKGLMTGQTRLLQRHEWQALYAAVDLAPPPWPDTRERYRGNRPKR